MRIPAAPGGPYTPPPPGGEPVLHAALAVEFEPGKVFWYQVRIDPTEGCEIELTGDDEPVCSAEYLAPVSYRATGPMFIRARLAGHLVSNDQGWRPGPVRTEATVEDRYLDGPPRALPGGTP